MSRWKKIKNETNKRKCMEIVAMTYDWRQWKGHVWDILLSMFLRGCVEHRDSRYFGGRDEFCLIIRLFSFLGFCWVSPLKSITLTLFGDFYFIFIFIFIFFVLGHTGSNRLRLHNNYISWPFLWSPIIRGDEACTRFWQCFVNFSCVLRLEAW